MLETPEGTFEEEEAAEDSLEEDSGSNASSEDTSRGKAPEADAGKIPTSSRKEKFKSRANSWGNAAEIFTIEGIDDGITARQELTVVATREDGSTLRFQAIARLDTPVDVLYYKNGGILQTVLRNLVRS